MSLNQIADRNGVAKRTVQKFMTVNNIPRRLRLEALNQSMMTARKPLPFSGFEDKIGYLLGVALGDGHVSKRSFELAVKDSDFAERFADVLNELGCEGIYTAVRKDGLHLVKINSTNISDFLKGLNFDMLTTAQKISFVNGFYDSEGSVFSKKYASYRGTYRKIACYNKDARILLSIQRFLKLNGISSYLSKRIMRGGHVIRKKYRHDYVLYELAIYNKRDLKNFAEVFELFGRKQIVLEGFRVVV